MLIFKKESIFLTYKSRSFKKPFNSVINKNILIEILSFSTSQFNRKMSILNKNFSAAESWIYCILVNPLYNTVRFQNSLLNYLFEMIAIKAKVEQVDAPQRPMLSCLGSLRQLEFDFI